MEMFKKLFNKNYLLKILIIVLGIMLFNSTVSNFISKYVSFLPQIGLEFLSMFIIILIIALISEEVLEI